MFAFANQRQQDGGTAQTPAGLLLRVWDNVGVERVWEQSFEYLRYFGKLVFGDFSEHLRKISHELMNNGRLWIWKHFAKSYLPWGQIFYSRRQIL